MKSFADLFNDYRLKSGYATFSQFAQALAEEGFIYEDSIFSKWKSGERVPRDRRVMLAILRVYIKSRSITQLEEANHFLASVGMRNLDDKEMLEFTVRLDVLEEPYSKYRPLLEPSALYQNLFVTKENTRFINLNDELRQYVREYWKYQSLCALADYYAASSHGRCSAEQVFEFMRNDYYDLHSGKMLLVAVTTDSSSDEEYLATSVRLVQGNLRSKFPLNIFRLIGTTEQWPHEATTCGDITNVAELDALVIPNWVWSEKLFVMREGYSCILQHAERVGIEYMYAIMLSYMLQLCEAAEIVTKVVPATYPLYAVPDAAVLHPYAYQDYETFPGFWEKDNAVYRFFGMNK